MKCKILICCLLSFVLSTRSQVPGFGRCPSTTVIQEFDVERYLGRWFEIKSYPFFATLGARCIEANYDSISNETVSVLNKQIRLGRYTSISGTAEVVQPGVGILAVNFPTASSECCNLRL